MKSAWKILSRIIILFILAIVLLPPNNKEAITSRQLRQAGGASLEGQNDALPLVEGPLVSSPVTPHISPPVKELPKAKHEPEYYLDREINPRQNLNPNLDPNFRSKGGLDPLLSLQAKVPKELGDGFTTPILSFEGQGFSGVNPPDTVGDVGPNHYIQMINGGDGALFQIYNKSGTLLAGPIYLDSLGAGACTNGLGDGIVLYDRLADRWMLSEFSDGGNILCVYVSQGPDPVNDSWYAYQFDTPNFPDYPKYAVWSDAYYVSSNENSPAVYALDRSQMLTGGAATSQRFTAPALAGFGFQAFTPSDLDGPMAPPANSPNYFIRHHDDEVHNSGSNDAAHDFLELWEFKVDFDTPANSSFTLATTIEISEIDSDLCGLESFNCFPQPASDITLDPLREVVMWRLQYRNFGTYEVLVGNLETDVDGSDHGGIRWFELRKSGGSAWSKNQEGTYAPDEHNRWMGSMAMDGSGNIALGYNISSNTIYPGIRYVGRLANDPAGTMPHGEVTLVTGNGSNASNRWGDYSSMNVDPADDCTFWYTNMYSPSSNWTTQIATFKFDNCGQNDFTLSANPASRDICIPNETNYTISIGQVGDFNEPVTLSASGNPAQTTATFSLNPVTPNTPAATSLLTVGNTAIATAGTYQIEVTGRAGQSSKTTTVELNLLAGVPNPPTLAQPADEATNISLQPTLTWNAVGQSTTYYLEVATNSTFSNIVYAVEVASTSQSLPNALEPSTTYYWRVRADNRCGEGGQSEGWQFTTTNVSTPTILLVDDDNNNPNVRPFYTAALDALGKQYDIWDRVDEGGKPTAQDMSDYQLIIWFTGNNFIQAGPNEAQMASYLDNTAGSSLFLSSQEYLWAQGGGGDDLLTDFMKEYLGASEGESDVAQTEVTGAGDFSDLGSYTLDYGDLNLYSDRIEPDQTAGVVFIGDQGNTAISKVTDNYQTTWWGFPFESIPTATARQEAMAKVLAWCEDSSPPANQKLYLPMVIKE